MTVGCCGVDQVKIGRAEGVLADDRPSFRDQLGNKADLDLAGCRQDYDLKEGEGECLHKIGRE